jgi:hypothetical protein
MTVALIGLVLLVASVGVWSPGVVLGAGLVALGLLLEFTSSTYS